MKFVGGRAGKEISNSDFEILSPVRPRFQDADGFCALHSVANAVDLDKPVFDEIYSKGPIFRLEDVVAIVNNRKTKQELRKVKGVPKTLLLNYLCAQKEGIFALEFEGHCVTWDANNQLILETDPCVTFAVPIMDDSLNVLGITKTSVEKAYRIRSL